MTVQRYEQLSLDDWAAYILEPYRLAVAGIIETGSRLIEAKAAVAHGDWLPLVDRLPFTESTAQRFMAIGRHPLITNTAYTQHLPAAWFTLYLLTRLDDLAERLERGDVHPALKQETVAGWVALAAHERRKAAYHGGAALTGDRYEIRVGDFRDELTDCGPVDGIVTDPPYGDEWLPLWADLGKLAADILRPGAPLIAWTGQFRLPQVLNMLAARLRYGWTICLDLPGTNSRVRYAQMIQTWKPIVVFTADTWGPHDWAHDRVTSPHQDQGLYEWQQNPDPAVELIDRYVSPGGLVVDPFVGVGSFGVAAVSSGRRFLGAELDDERAAAAAHRIAEAAP